MAQVGAAEQRGEEVSRVLPQLRIDELLDELYVRLASIRSSRDRVRQLLDAVVGIGSGLDLEAALTRIVQAAATLVDAQYGALGVLANERRSARFITVGSNDGIPAGDPPTRSSLSVPIRIREEVFGNLFLTGKRGGVPFDADDEVVLSALAAAAGVAIDNARLYDEARRRQEWLEITSELTRGLLSGEDVDDVLAAFARRMRRFADAALVVIALPESQRGELLIVAADGLNAQRLPGVPLGLEDTLMGAVYKSGRLELVPDLNADPRFSRDLMPDVRFGPGLVVPLGTAGQVRGVSALFRLAGAALYDAALADLTADLTVQVAAALELAERRRDGELLTLYADRDRIGRDLHDLAIQRLFATSMSLQGAYKITQKSAVAGRISQAITGLDETINVIRSTIFALHPYEAPEGEPGLRAQVMEVCEQAAGLLGFAASVRFSGPVDDAVGERVADQLLAVLREALSNVARHAAASKVEVDLAADGDAVTLSVIDDGVGLAPGERGSGLATLRERAQQLGGTCTARSGTGGGTVLTWRAPTGLDVVPGD